jgi:hypothetical protein
MSLFYKVKSRRKVIEYDVRTEDSFIIGEWGKKTL